MKAAFVEESAHAQMLAIKTQRNKYRQILHKLKSKMEKRR
jgi:hypothetical protein